MTVSNLPAPDPSDTAPAAEETRAPASSSRRRWLGAVWRKARGRGGVASWPTTWSRPGSFGRLNVAANRALVSAYKLLGFLILTTILLGITSFVGIHTFYLIHRAWVIPRIISPTDPEVLALRSRLAEESRRRASIENERRTTRARLERLRLMAQAEQSFRESLPAAVASGAAQRRDSLVALQAAQQEQQRVHEELTRTGQALQTGSREQLERDFAARLITEQQLLEGSYQLAQLAQTRSNLMERQAELNERIRRLSREVGALEAATAPASDAGADASGAEALSYEALQVRREHARSRAEGIGAMSEIAALERSDAELARSIEEYDRLLTVLRNDPLLKASEQQLHLAFVAYDNEPSIAEGSALYGCHLVLAICERVGRVARYLPGEHAQDHPVYGKELRGQWAQIELEDTHWAKAKVLHANRPPLLF